MELDGCPTFANLPRLAVGAYVGRKRGGEAPPEHLDESIHVSRGPRAYPAAFSFQRIQLPGHLRPPAPKMLTSIIEGQHAGKNPTAATLHRTRSCSFRRKPLCARLPAPAGRPYAGMVPAPGRPLYAGISGRT